MPRPFAVAWASVFCASTAVEIAFVVDPLDSLKAYKDSSIAMMRAAQARGHTLFAFEQADIYWTQGETHAHARPLTVGPDNDAWFRAGDPTLRRLSSFAAVLMRKDPPFDMEYVYTTYLLEAAEREGARIYNQPRAVRDNNEKLAITRFGEFTAPTLVTRDAALINEFIDAHGVMAQRFIPEIAAGDKRILVIAGEAVPYALARIPKPGETRGNLAAGGRGVAQPLTARDKVIANTLGPKLWAEGLLVVGLDVIGDYLTEVNVTSPTCFVEISEQSGFDVGARFAEALERAVAGR